MKRSWGILTAVFLLVVAFGAFTVGRNYDSPNVNDEGYSVGHVKGYSEGFQAANSTAYATGYASGYYDRLAEILKPTEPPEVISLEEALAIMARSRYTHQYYLDRPAKMQERADKLGETFEEMTVFHTAIIKRYDAVINVLQRAK